ncbi:MAG: universal stress protein [Actinomycetia bacterium]|nr:universal stress protein [Actinomycetes bacterium]
MATPSADCGSVIVGVDGSDGSRHGLLWALDKEGRFGSVRPVVASQEAFGATAKRRHGVKRSEDDAHERWRPYLDAIQPGLADVTTVVDSAPGPGLVAASSSADLLVVGSRGRSAVAEALLGSVASYCVKHAHVPVAVVPGSAPARQPLSVMVVGVDGSRASQAALSWALRHVDADGKVIALGGSPAVIFSSDIADPMVDPVERFTRQRVEETVAKVRGVDGQGPTIEIAVTEDDAKAELRRVAQDADLLVVGSSGHHGIRRLFHRSVATSIAHHPGITTVVVPPGKD